MYVASLHRYLAAFIRATPNICFNESNLSSFAVIDPDTTLLVSRAAEAGDLDACSRSSVLPPPTCGLDGALGKNELGRELAGEADAIRSPLRSASSAAIFESARLR